MVRRDWTIHEQYKGLEGQDRIALVDRTGRIYHYDLEELALTACETLNGGECPDYWAIGLGKDPCPSCIAREIFYIV